ncbi:MAG TPA: hypothetical protein VFZ21_05260 [Gemmatimonadaceae bacterium]|nr:hypothetical protein [Gemmatimonadaceae bacterium]
MHKLVKVSVLPVAALALACGRSTSDEAPVLADDLKRDLQAAASASVELAAGARDYQLTRVVSAIESPRSSAPVKRRTVRKPVAQPVAANEPEIAKAPDPAPENAIDVAEPQPAEEVPTPAIDTPTNVAVSPRPTPVGTAPATTDAGSGSVGGGSGGGGLGGVGEAIGTIIGVVIVRGGAGGIDHCDPRRDRRPNGGPIAMPNPRYPGPRGTDIIANNPIPHRPTFPTRRF